MRFTPSSVMCLAVAGVLMLTGTPSIAQHAGFQIGIAPAFNAPVVVPGFGQPMVAPFTTAPTVFGFTGVQAPVTVTRGGFVGNGFVTGPFGGFGFPTPQVFVGSPVVVPGQVFGSQVIFPGQGQVIPGQVFPGQVFPGQVFPGQVFPGQVFPGQVFPGQVFPEQVIPGQVFPNQVFVPSSVFTQTPRLYFGPPATSVQLPPIGTPRAEVLKQFGQPRASIITANDETLHFDGGVMVIIKNGQVAGSK